MVLTVSTNSGATISGLKNGGSNVNPSNYVIDGYKLTINGTYLSGLTHGTKTFTIIMSNGETASAKITVGA